MKCLKFKKNLSRFNFRWIWVHSMSCCWWWVVFDTLLFHFSFLTCCYPHKMHKILKKILITIHMMTSHLIMMILMMMCPGDEIIEWNGRSLHGRSPQEVYDIIADSRHETQVELIVSRLLATGTMTTTSTMMTAGSANHSRGAAAQQSWRNAHSPVRFPSKGIQIHIAAVSIQLLIPEHYCI